MSSSEHKSKRSRWADAEEQPHNTGFSISKSDGPGGCFSVAAAAAAAKEALEKARKAAAYQRQIQEQINALRAPRVNVNRDARAAAHAFRHQQQLGGRGGLKFDELGRQVDEQGKLVPMTPVVHSTLKININRERTQRLKKLQSSVKMDRQVVVQASHHDNSITVKKVRKKGFRFAEKGLFLKQERQMLRQAEAKALGINLSKLQSEKADIEKRDRSLFYDSKKDIRILKKLQAEKANNPDLSIINDSDYSDDDSDQSQHDFNPNLIPVSGASAAQCCSLKVWDPVPIMEWWDERIALKDTPTQIDQGKISQFVEHPIPLGSNTTDSAAAGPRMYLTKIEQKKLRRRRRQEKEHEKQDRVRMGLLPPAPPKVKLSNLMRVLGDSAVADPSRVEREVRLQMESRIKAHEARNRARKAASSNRKTKKASKWKVLA